MVSQTAKYALRILSVLVERQHELVRAEEIARRTGIPANYLSKILNQLRKSRIVESQKGWHGGFRLRRRALERPIRDVLASIDGAESTQRTDCIFGLSACNASQPCPLHSHWERVRNAHATMLNETRIADLVAH